jgi:hypothetical protein
VYCGNQLKLQPLTVIAALSRNGVPRNLLNIQKMLPGLRPLIFSDI